MSTSTPLQTKTTNRNFHNFDNLFAKLVPNHINKLPTICNSMKSATLRGDFVYLNFVVSFEAELDTFDNFSHFGPGTGPNGEAKCSRTEQKHNLIYMFLTRLMSLEEVLAI